MKMAYKLLVIAVLLTSCAIVVKKHNHRKLVRNYGRVQDIIQKYPEFADTLFEVRYDTVVVKGVNDSTSYTLGLDSVYVDSLLASYVKSTIELIQFKKENDSLKYLSDSSKAEYNRLLELSLGARKDIVKGFYLDSTYVYEDSLLNALISINNGDLDFVFEVKDRIEVVRHESESITISNKPCKCNFWKERIFWMLVCLVFLLVIFLIRKK